MHKGGTNDGENLFGVRSVSSLNARKVPSLKEPGMDGDGNGLCLRVGPTASKSWGRRILDQPYGRCAGLSAIRSLQLNVQFDEKFKNLLTTPFGSGAM